MQQRKFRRYFSSLPFKTRALYVGMILYLFIFAFLSVFTRNREFLYYTILIFGLFLFVVSYYHRLKLTETLLLGIAVHWLLHFMGGALRIGATRLYDFWFIPGYLKYDNIVHAFGIVVLTFIAYNLLRPHFKLKDRVSLLHFSVLLFFVVMGIGALSELFELGAVLWFNAADTVGDYFNNAFDLLYNAIGAVFACILISRYELRFVKKK